MKKNTTLQVKINRGGQHPLSQFKNIERPLQHCLPQCNFCNRMQTICYLFLRAASANIWVATFDPQ